MGEPLKTSRENTPTWQLPGIRDSISDNKELREWRRNLYGSMTSRSTNAISRFLSENLQVVEMMQVLNKRSDKTKKSKWATLQSIIKYQKGYTHNSEITPEDVRRELENIDQIFSPQRTVEMIIDDIRTKTLATEHAEREALLSIDIAGFQMPLVGKIRRTISELLQQSEMKKEVEETSHISTPEVIKEITPPPSRTVTTPTLLGGPLPRSINAAGLHKIGVAEVQRLRTGGSPSYTPERRPPQKPPQGVQNPPEKQKPQTNHKRNSEILIEHRQFILTSTENQEIIESAWKKSHKNNQSDSLVFENFIRSKKIEILTTLQAIKRIGNYKNWQQVLQYIFGRDISLSQVPEPPKIVVETPQTTAISIPKTKITPTTKHSPGVVPQKKSTPTSPPTKDSIQEPPKPQDYETLAYQILENQEWMVFLDRLCQLHTEKQYAQFHTAWLGFKQNTEDDMQIDLWNALFDCKQARNTEAGIIHIAFELCGRAFSETDKDLYSKKFTRKKRIPELLKNIDAYEHLVRDLEGIHTYDELANKISTIILSAPVEEDSWLLYQEKICPKYSLKYLVEKDLQRQYASKREASKPTYLRTAKKIIRKLGK